MRKLADLLKIRAGEERTAGLVISIMILTSGGGSIGGTAIEALFYSRFGVDFLPYMYMVVGPTILATSLIITGVLGQVKREILYAVLPLALGSVLIAEWAIGRGAHPNWFYPFMWVLMNVLGMLQGLLTWGLAGVVCDTRQAKRLFPLFGAGGILGAVVGGFLTRPLVNLIGSENLLLIWAGALGFSFILSRLLTRAAQPSAASLRSGRARRLRPSLITEMRQGFDYVQRSQLMRWIAVSAVLFSTLFFSLAFPFNKAVTAQYSDADDLAGFLGLFNGLSTGAALIVSLMVANRLYARLGIMTTILVLPIIYLAGFSVLAVSASFTVLIAFRFVQALWLMGVASPAYQAVFNIVPTERREQTRAFFSGVPDQAGTVIAGLVLVIGERALTLQQFYVIGLAVAGVTVFALWRARQAYSGALVDLLKVGQPQVFFAEDEPFGGFQRDAQAINAALRGMDNPDQVVRRVSAEVLGNLNVPDAANRLVGALQDSDGAVRLAALRGLVQAKAAPALLDVALCLNDEDAEVRLGAIKALQALAGYRYGLLEHIRRLLKDPATSVKAQAAGVLLAEGQNSEAKMTLQEMIADANPSTRAAAVAALGRIARTEDFQLVATSLDDPNSVVRVEAANGLAYFGDECAIEKLVTRLGDDDNHVLEAVAKALQKIGSPAQQATIDALNNPSLEGGALLSLESFPTSSFSQPLAAYAHSGVERAVHYHDLHRRMGSTDNDDRKTLLAVSVEEKAHWHAANAIRAASLNRNRVSVRVALASLKSRDTGQRSSALETLETIVKPEIIRPLLPLWDTTESLSLSPDEWLPAILEDSDPWLRACAALAVNNLDHPAIRTMLERIAESDIDPLAQQAARITLKGYQTLDTLQTLSTMERILFLRKVPLFMELSPSDLKHVASISGERFYGDGEVIAEQGETGDEMYVIVSGEVKVLIADKDTEREIARRTSGDAVGEMSVIGQEPRIATLMAAGEVRVLAISQKQFEGILRERPETGLAVMRVLIARLKELQAMLSSEEPNR